jgi:antitoxin HicB
MEGDILMSKLFKIPLVLEPQKEGGWTVTSPVLPELITEVDDLQQMDEVVRDAMNAVIELYEDTGKEFPPGNLLMGQVPFNGAARGEMLRG